MTDYVICVRKTKGGKFIPEPSEPGATRFLQVPDGAEDIEPHHKEDIKAWIKNVMNEAEHGKPLTS